MKTKTIANKLMMPLFVLVNIFSTVVLSQTSPEGHYRDDQGNIVFNLSACTKIPCELTYSSVKIRVLGGVSSLGTIYHSTSAPLVISSPVPINHIRGSAKFGKSELTKSTRTLTMGVCINSKEEWTPVSTEQNKNINKVQIYFDGGCSSSVPFTYVSVKSGNTDTIVDDMKAASAPLIQTYKSISEHLSDFRQIVSKNSSDARHLNRLESQIKNTLKLMADEKGDALLPVTHRKITESSRMIMVLSTVLEEITDSYDFTSRFLEPLVPAKKSLTKLSHQIRTLYGWDEGLAGSGSKALAALGTILDSELRSLYSLTATFNNDAKTAQAFNAIFRANSVLVAKVNASNAGDIAGTDAAKTVIQNWNSAEFQSILQLAMSAPKDAQSQIQNRILMALTAIESIKDYVDPKGELKSAIDLPTSVRSKLN